MTEDKTSAHKKARVLVIDDDELVRDTLRAVLESGGYEVLLAADGDEGLRVFEAEDAAIISPISSCQIVRASRPSANFGG